MQEIEFTDAEVKEDLWAWNDFQDRILAEEELNRQQGENNLVGDLVSAKC